MASIALEPHPSSPESSLGRGEPLPRGYSVSPSAAMSFLTEFVSNFIKRTLMEDPLARREARNKHLAEVFAKANELCVPSRSLR